MPFFEAGMHKTQIIRCPVGWVDVAASRGRDPPAGPPPGPRPTRRRFHASVPHRLLSPLYRCDMLEPPPIHNPQQLSPGVTANVVSTPRPTVRPGPGHLDPLQIRVILHQQHPL